MEELPSKPRMYIHKDMGPPGAGRGLGGSLAGRTAMEYFLLLRPPSLWHFVQQLKQMATDWLPRSSQPPFSCLP